MDHKAIIAKLGGIRGLARRLGHPVHTTVQGWSDRNRIPVEHWPDVVRVSGEAGAPVAPADLMPAELRGAA